MACGPSFRRGLDLLPLARRTGRLRYGYLTRGNLALYDPRRLFRASLDGRRLLGAAQKPFGKILAGHTSHDVPRISCTHTFRLFSGRGEVEDECSSAIHRRLSINDKWEYASTFASPNIAGSHAETRSRGGGWACTSASPRLRVRSAMPEMRRDPRPHADATMLGADSAADGRPVGRRGAGPSTGRRGPEVLRILHPATMIRRSQIVIPPSFLRLPRGARW
jgi:hypothetical protein